MISGLASAPPLGLDFKNPNWDPLGGEEEEDGEQSFLAQRLGIRGGSKER